VRRLAVALLLTGLVASPGLAEDKPADKEGAAVPAPNLGGVKDVVKDAVKDAIPKLPAKPTQR